MFYDNVCESASGLQRTLRYALMLKINDLTPVTSFRLFYSLTVRLNPGYDVSSVCLFVTHVLWLNRTS